MSRIVYVAVAAALVGIGGLLFLHMHTRSIAVAPQGTLGERESFWKGRIEAVGASDAYAEFAQSVSTLSPAKQHENAHTFGGALFDAEGTAGLATCDARFSYGCFHEFLGRAIASLGMGIVDSLNQGCVDALGGNALSCQHGIGHGVQAALGYDESALKKALRICENLPYNDPIGGCYGGVFMEYNMQTMLGEQARTRPEKPGDPLYPCDVLSAAYLPACAFWSPQWWINLQHQAGAPTVDTKAIGSLCDSFTDAHQVRACYEGLGTVVPPEGAFEPATVRDLCDRSSLDPVHQLYCLSYAANSLDVGGSGQKGDAAAVCDGLSDKSYAYCMAYAQNKANLAVPLDAL
ncbi:MAG TPA: hypothetical protein VHD38_01525 [Candidatus Paceibacterota bacterium]|nr:hypothetical protein [Candidatus Paceibacterota bacterium]